MVRLHIIVTISNHIGYLGWWYLAKIGIIHSVKTIYSQMPNFKTNLTHRSSSLKAVWRFSLYLVFKSNMRSKACTIVIYVRMYCFWNHPLPLLNVILPLPRWKPCGEWLKYEEEGLEDVQKETKVWHVAEACDLYFSQAWVLQSNETMKLVRSNRHVSTSNRHSKTIVFLW